MKNAIRLFSILLLLSSANIAYPKYLWSFDDSLDDFFDAMEEDLRSAREHMAKMQAANKEEQDALKVAKANLAKIKPEVKQDDDSVIVAFSIENIEKKSIHTEIKDNMLRGSIPTKDGKVSFTIDNNYLVVTKTIELKKEEKAEKNYSHSSFASMSSNYYPLPTAIDLTKDNIKISTKDNQLLITIAKTKGIEIPIQHS